MTQSDTARRDLRGTTRVVEDYTAAREFDDPLAKARDYVMRLEEFAGAYVSCIGVGQAGIRRSCRDPANGALTSPRAGATRSAGRSP